MAPRRLNAEMPGGMPQVVSSPSLYAAAQLQFADGELTGIGINSRFAGAFPMDVGKYYVAFIDEQPDIDYMAQASAGHCMAYVLLDEKWTDGFMITTTNQAGEPVDVEFVNISIVRS